MSRMVRTCETPKLHAAGWGGSISVSATFGASIGPQYMEQEEADVQLQVLLRFSTSHCCIPAQELPILTAIHKLVHSFRHLICGQLQGKSKRPSRRTLKRLPQDIRHQLEQLQVPPELLANPKVTTIETDECSYQEAPLGWHAPASGVLRDLCRITNVKADHAAVRQRKSHVSTWMLLVLRLSTSAPCRLRSSTVACQRSCSSTATQRRRSPMAGCPAPRLGPLDSLAAALERFQLPPCSMPRCPPCLTMVRLTALLSGQEPNVSVQGHLADVTRWDMVSSTSVPLTVWSAWCSGGPSG